MSDNRKFPKNGQITANSTENLTSTITKNNSRNPDLKITNGTAIQNGIAPSRITGAV